MAHRVYFGFTSGDLSQDSVIRNNLIFIFSLTNQLATQGHSQNTSIRSGSFQCFDHEPNDEHGKRF